MAGDQGVPLVSALHCALFDLPGAWCMVCSIGGTANLTVLSPQTSDTRDTALDFDCGPGSTLTDCWVYAHRDSPYDADGVWARNGRVDEALLERPKAKLFFVAPPPKNIGRDPFSPAWLQQTLGDALDTARLEDVQTTLLALTTDTIADAVRAYAPQVVSLLVCGGSAHNDALMARIGQQLPGVRVAPTNALGVPAHQVEALAFTWLVRQCMFRTHSNLHTAAGTSDARTLGTVYPA